MNVHNKGQRDSHTKSLLRNRDQHIMTNRQRHGKRTEEEMKAKEGTLLSLVGVKILVTQYLLLVLICDDSEPFR